MKFSAEVLGSVPSNSAGVMAHTVPVVPAFGRLWPEDFVLQGSTGLHSEALSQIVGKILPGSHPGRLLGEVLAA